jgi:hypothetical protein
VAEEYTFHVEFEGPHPNWPGCGPRATWRIVSRDRPASTFSAEYLSHVAQNRWEERARVNLSGFSDMVTNECGVPLEVAHRLIEVALSHLPASKGGYRYPTAWSRLLGTDG